MKGRSSGVEVLGAALPRGEEVLTPEALEFVADLARTFGPVRQALLGQRVERQRRLDAGERPDFLPGTAAVRAGSWTVAPPPADLVDRRVEITGPTDRKMIIHALNSGARVFMADLEDATSPSWSNMVDGQVNLRDAVRRTIEFPAVDGAAPTLRLNPATATLVVRPRGWHLEERHVRVDGLPVPGSLFDFGLFLFHNAREQVARGTGPYFYLPKLEGHLEARLWNDVFLHAQGRLGLPPGTIRATVLIETVLAAFEMDEILYELRQHITGLNCGRWDYIFSVIKKFRAHPGFVLPDRATVTMDRHFLRSYTQLLVKTCHRRGAHAIGGMAAQIPVKADAEANRRAIERVTTDKEREVRDGHDGTWVAHPALVPLVRDIFDREMPGPNQVDRQRDDVRIVAADLLQMPEGTITESGIRHNVAVGLRYLESWIRGKGCVPIFHLMEDAATAEISRSQLWQWVHHAARLDDDRVVTPAVYRAVRDAELAHLRDELGDTWDRRRFDDATALLDRLVLDAEFAEFLTVPAYDLLP